MPVSPRRCALACATTLALAGCGAGAGPDFSQRTPPPGAGSARSATPPPVAIPHPSAREPRPSQRDAERLRPVLRGWATAVRTGHGARAARYFAVPAIVAQSQTVRLRTRDQIQRFNDQLPCGATLLEVQHDGRYVVGTFRLTARAGKQCTAEGQLARVAFVIRGHRFTEWRQVPDQPGAPPGPEGPEDAPSGESA